MTKTILNFEDLDSGDKKWFLNETWCSNCQKADLGIRNPVLYKENDITYVGGNCKICGEPQHSEIVIERIDEKIL